MLEYILDFIVFLFGEKMENRIENSDIEKVKKIILTIILILATLVFYFITSWLLMNR